MAAVRSAVRALVYAKSAYDSRGRGTTRARHGWRGASTPCSRRSGYRGGGTIAARRARHGGRRHHALLDAPAAGVLHAVDDEAVATQAEAGQGEGRACEVAAQSLACDVVVDGDMDARMQVEALVHGGVRVAGTPRRIFTVAGRGPGFWRASRKRRSESACACTRELRRTATRSAAGGSDRQYRMRIAASKSTYGAFG